ncbi:MAG: HNH endonuclease, partial [Acidimicrobiia bacterium]|nr:HNH endonuclease [Acidimicrobiia bacterium]
KASTDRSGEAGRCELERTGPISAETARRIACDAGISRIITDPDGIPLDVGRSRRTVPPPLRKAVVARDRGCRFQGCDRLPSRCQAHHVIHWSHGGVTSLDNLVLLCSHHHHLLHEGGWNATLRNGVLHIYRPDGTEFMLHGLAA